MTPHRQKRKEKRKHLLFFLSALFLFLVVGGMVVRLVRMLNDAYWDGQERMTLVLSTVEGDVFALLSLEPAARQATYVTIQPLLELSVPYQYGSYPAFSVYALGKLDPEKRGGGYLLAKSVEQTLSVAVDGFLVSKNREYISFPQESLTFPTWKEEFFSLWGLPRFVHIVRSSLFDSNLTAIDLFRLWNALRGLRTDQIAFKTLARADMVERSIRADGVTLERLKPDAFALSFSADFHDSRIRKERTSVKIVNATEKEGLAGFFGTLLENMGATVVEKTSAKEKEQGGCRLILATSETGKRLIVSKLMRLYRCTLDTDASVSSTTDITVILGEKVLSQ